MLGKMNLANISTALIALTWPSSVFPQVMPPSRGKPLSFEDAIKIRSLAPYSPPGLSPDGTLLAYAVIESQESRHFEAAAWARTGVPWYGTGAQIFVLNVKTGATDEVTSGIANNWLPTWSPDGSSLAFLSDRDGSGQAGLWVWNRANSQLRKISSAKIRTDQIEWLPDSAKMVVETMPEGISVEDYEARVASPGTRVGPVPRAGSGATVNVYEAGVVSSTGQRTPLSDPWNLDQMLKDLTLIDVRSGSLETLVHGVRIAAYRLSPGGTAIAFSIPKQFEKPGSQQILFDLVTLTLATQRQQVVAPDIRFDYNGDTFSWSPDGLQLGFCSGADGTGYGCHVVLLNKPRSSNVPPFAQAQTCAGQKVSRPLWTAKGDAIYFVCDGALWRGSTREGVLEHSHQVARVENREITRMISKGSWLLWTLGDGNRTMVVTHDDDEKRDGFYRVDLESGRSTKMIEAEQCYLCVPQQDQVLVSADGVHAVYSAEDAQHPADLCVLGGESLSEPRRLTDLNPQFREYKMGEPRLIDWLSDDGERLQGALLLPADYHEGNRYPLLVYVYGGSSLSNNFNRFGLAFTGPFNMQLFATRGYAVLLPDSPQHLGTPMLDLAKTVLPGVNKVIEMGIADDKRLGIMGHSNGGYGTLGLIVLTKRFKAAMTADGTGDLLSLYGEMNRDGTAYGTANTESGQNALGGTPWEVRDKFVENSPFFYLERVETPLLIVHGTEDTAVAPFLGDQLFIGLRRLGKEVKYAKYEGEGHSPSYWSHANQTDFCRRMIEWFDRHLQGEGVR